VGRKSTLVASLMLMGLSTLLIAFLPTYAMAGPIAPALLCLLRFGRASGLAANGAGPRCWPWRTRRRWEARFGPRRSWVRRWASLPPMACS
jgi:MFS family permease